MNINELFLKLPEEKQKSILESALTVFAEKGYEQASTNTIVEVAGISKGVLFKYFGNKETLFKYVVRRKLEQKKQWMDSGKENMPAGFFDVLLWYTMREMEFIKAEPEFFFLMKYVDDHNNAPLHKEVLKLASEYSQDIIGILLRELPADSLRAGISVPKAFTFISLVFESYKRQAIQKVNTENWEAEIQKEVEELFDFIKNGIFEAGCG